MINDHELTANMSSNILPADVFTEMDASDDVTDDPCPCLGDMSESVRMVKFIRIQVNKKS